MWNVWSFYLGLSTICLILSLFRCHSFFITQKFTSKLSNRSLILLSKPADLGNSDDESPQVSDREALLACRAYLIHRKRLGWPEGERRKEKRKENIGFGWGEGTESPFGDDNNDAIDNDGFTPTMMYDEDEFYRIEKEYDLLSYDGNKKEEEYLGVFRGMPLGPSKEHARQSQRQKNLFRDPIWREKWYRARWGNHVKLTPEMKRERKNRSRFNEVPVSVWTSPEFETLTEEEIQAAIRVYTSSNQKRSQSLKKEEQDRIKKEEYEQFTRRARKGKLNPFFTPQEDILKEQQRKRSEKAKKSYQTRLERMRERGEDTSIRHSFGGKSFWRPTGSSPHEALIRINSDLNSDRRPKLQDVELMMKPKHLSSRRITLRRILLECFNLRGKCIPNEGILLFVTHARIRYIGRFVLELLSKEELDEPIN